MRRLRSSPGSVEAVAAVRGDGVSGEATSEILTGHLEGTSLAGVGRCFGAEQAEQVGTQGSCVDADRVVGAEHVDGLAQVGGHVGDVSGHRGGILDPLQGHLAARRARDLLLGEVQLVELPDGVACLEVVHRVLEGAQR